MTPAERRVLDMVNHGTISASEADHLLSALRQPRSWTAVLFKPLDVLPTTTALLGGVLIAALGVAVGLTGIRFDGVLDVHMARSVSLTVALTDAANALGSAALVLWATSLLVGSRGRFVDHLAAVALARAPTVLMGGVLAAAVRAFPRSFATLAQTTGHPRPTTFVLVFSMAVIPLLVWSVALLYFGFKTASGLKRVRLVASFIVGAVAAEVLSKLVVMYLT